MTDNPSTLRPLRLAILQRVCPGYRIALFRKLSEENTFYTTLFIGDDLPNSKVKNAPSLHGIRFRKLKTRFIKLGSRLFPFHVGLIGELRKYQPDVILCEGESHFLGYLQAILYRSIFNKRAALIHWCFISLPGEPLSKPGLADVIKRFARKYFDAFLLYSSYSKHCLVQLGVSPEKAFVATNVGDVQKFLLSSDLLKVSKLEARERLALPEKFTILYTGTLDRNKKPEMILGLAKICDQKKFNFILLGSGELLSELRDRVLNENLSNVYLPGRVTDDLPLYYKASDVLIIPGRGGIIISEAMTFSVPVITYQADGTEYDLIKDNETGFLLKNGEIRDFQLAIEKLQNSPELTFKMGKLSRELIETRYTTANMVNQIFSAASFAQKARNKIL